MEALDAKVLDIIDHGLEGKGIEAGEIRTLVELPERSREMALVRQAGMELSLQAADGIAEIHAQIGLNATPCPKNCKFCSFARCNGVRSGKVELEKQQVIDYAKAAEEGGANAVLLLTTASYSFDKLAEMAQAVREVLSPEMPLLVNTDDMTLERARRLKAIGVDGAYHAVRMREGIDTQIPVEERMKTFAHLRQANLSLSTCVEPIGPEHSPDEVIEAFERCIKSEPQSAGAARRVAVKGTVIYERGMITELQNANLVAIYRLASGLVPRLNCSANTCLTASAGANLAWTEVGSNPRDTVKLTEHGGRANPMELCKRTFTGAGWQLREGPSPGWRLS